MKKTVFAILALFAITGIFAQQQPVVAVAPFDAISGISATDAAMITRVFFIRLGNTQKVSLVDRSMVERILKEHQFQAGNWSNAQKTAELGAALNADWIVRGELEKFGTNILVTVQFYDIQTFRFMGGSELLLTNAEEAMQKMDPLVDKLVTTIVSTGSQTRKQSNNSPLLGQWKAKNTDFILEFNSDGTFIGVGYYSKTTVSYWSHADKDTNWYGKLYNYSFGGGVSMEEYTLIRGSISGTYTFTAGTLSLVYTISGSLEKQTLISVKYGHDEVISSNPNYTSQGNLSVSYIISPDQKTLTIGQHPIFLKSITTYYSPRPAEYYSEFLKQ